ncbi:MAG: aldehyde dehydrogenase family protein [Planctomycetota bacterium]
MSPTEQRFQRISPVTGEPTWVGPASSPAQVRSAVDLAANAFPVWRRIEPAERIACIRNYAGYLAQHRDAIATAITLESGKPLWESRIEVGTSIAKVDLAIEAIRERRDLTVHSAGNGNSSNEGSEVRYRPIGPVLVLGPFNLPLHLPGAHIVPALAAGNTVVFKSSEKTPMVGEHIACAMAASGLPDGVFQLLQGGASVAIEALQSAQLGGVFFTGSRNAGVAIHRQLAGRPEVLLALEMGGNNPLVVDRLRNTRAAVEIILQSAYITSGQRCTCARRLIVIDTPDNRRLIEQLTGILPKIRIGDPMAEIGSFLGTMIDDSAVQSVLDKQRQYLDRGMIAMQEAKVRDSLPTQLSPGLLDANGVEPDDDEVFGPLLVLQWVSDLETAIATAQRTRYGLSASLLSDDPEAWRVFQREVDAGVLNWNHPTTGATGTLPFGGLGWSGNHRSSGYFACDYCSDPSASLVRPQVMQASKTPVGLEQIWDAS